MTIFMVMFVFLSVFMIVFMVMMVVEEHLLSLFHAVHENGHMRARDPAFHGGLRLKAHPGNAQGIDSADEFRPLFFSEQFQQRRRQHVAGSTHPAVQIDSPHSFVSIWLIMDARYPAPNPLSILTTETPLAQELSIERSAERPLNEAP